MTKIKRAIIVAAGEGKRLRPVTIETPKPLVKVHGERMIDTSIRALKKNGIHEIYIIVGYKKEQFMECYKDDPDIHILVNDNYEKGNNITSLYLAREYLPESFVVEADLIIKDESIFKSEVEKSGYVASWKNPATEWVLTVEDNTIKKCEVDAKKPGYQLWGISMWNREDGNKLSEKIAYEYEKGNWDVYWDMVALDLYGESFDLGIREINGHAICEIDSMEELMSVDASYREYLTGEHR